ncbi:Hypothetical protein D9617_20g028010 [Elsinoe fawcettii]|nr:Hypothetical protein D9617_20g028010 [Elsinoe fawcettii]
MATTQASHPASLRLSSHKILSLSCYHTLIDGLSGLTDALKPLFCRLEESHPFRQSPRLAFRKFDDLISRLQQDNPSSSSTAIVAIAYMALAGELGITDVTDMETSKFIESAGTWPPFPDTMDALRRLRKHFKVVISTNADQFGFAVNWQKGLDQFPYEFIVSSDLIGRYKPDRTHFVAIADRVQVELGIEKKDILHVSQGVERDLVPAKAEGLATVWISRYGDYEDTKGAEVSDWQFHSLAEMADAVERELGNGSDHSVGRQMIELPSRSRNE